jgi:pimeloyl-ACP methyl ester carboxylesterase
MRLYLLVLLSALLMACGGYSSPNSAATASGLASWPVSQQGENPPPAPEQFEPIVTNGDELASMLPSNVATRLFDPVAFGYTINDISDPVVVEHMVRSTFAQLQDGSRPQHAYHWYGHPDENAGVALIPVEFYNRYGTKLYGEIVLPYAATGSPKEGPFPVIIALEGLNTNIAMYRWWHRLFADNGYMVFAFDFSGQGHSDDEAEGDPGNNLHDAQDAMTYLFEQSSVASVLNAEQVGVIGHSMGAAAVLRVQEQEASNAIEPNPVRIKAAVAAAPVGESVSASPIPIMIQTGDHDGPIAPLPFINPAVVRPLYDSFENDRAFIVAEASSHGQHTNYPFLPTATWGRDIAATYSLAWMNYYLRGDVSALSVLEGGHPHLSFLHDSATRINALEEVYRGNGLAPDPAEFQ